jgi:peptidoglycan LD-endopeptidase LytH
MKRGALEALLTVLALSLMVSLVPHRAQAAGYRVVVSGMAVDGAQPELRNGQLTVAVRPFVEAMGGYVTWNAGTQQVSMGLDGSQVAMWVGNTLAYQDGGRLWAPVAPFIRNGKTMVPAWWLAARFHMQVSFDGTTLRVSRKGSQMSQSSDPLMNPNYYFPYAKGALYEPFYNTWGDGRYYEGRNFTHEGADILAPKGTPIYAVASGTIVRYGWNTLGGYRLNIQLDDHPGWRFYYAHLDRYANGLYPGAHVKAGQLIGYTGSTGEGPERTEGLFVPHLHFGIYRPDGTAINAYPYLKFWELHKVQW